MNRVTRCVEDSDVRIEIGSKSFEGMTLSMIDLTGDLLTPMVLSLNLAGAKKLNDLLYDAIRDMEKGPKDGI